MARKLKRPRHPQANLDVVEAYCVCAFALGAVKADCLPKQTLVADSCLHGAPAGEPQVSASADFDTQVPSGPRQPGPPLQPQPFAAAGIVGVCTRGKD
jgi:hypothetical protein